jgi:putative protein kinase ArgK-like GTPase of G3E family
MGLFREVAKAITAVLDSRARRRIANTLHEELRMRLYNPPVVNCRKHTAEGLVSLLATLEQMHETVCAALAGEVEALDEIITEFRRGPDFQNAVGKVEEGIQFDDYAAAEEQYQKEMEREEARRCCEGEKPM